MHRIKRQALCLSVMILTLASFGCGDKEKSIQLEEVQISESSGNNNSPEADEEKKAVQDKEPDTIFVDVCGQVASPGVYELPAGSRVYEAVNAAGGILDTAAGEALNQARKLEDGQQVYVPSRDEAAGMAAAPGEMTEEDNVPEDGRVNLNTAGREELMTLTGIGEAKAGAILKYREEHGGFKSPEDIMQVEGIKQGTYEKIKEQIKTD